MTFRVSEKMVTEIEDIATERDVSKSEVAREYLECGSEYADLRSEYEERVEELKQENDRLRREKRLILEQRTEHNELIEYVEHERSLQERREDRLDAPVWKRGYWWVFGRNE